MRSIQFEGLGQAIEVDPTLLGLGLGALLLASFLTRGKARPQERRKRSTEERKKKKIESLRTELRRLER